jgi:hypothetical protein
MAPNVHPKATTPGHIGPTHLADSKVTQHDDATTVQEYVLCLQVAVQHPETMDVQQR